MASKTLVAYFSWWMTYRKEVHAVGSQSINRGTEPVTTAVPAPQRSDISCSPDSINIFLPANLLANDRNVTWRDDSCQVDFNGTHFIGSISLNDCGTTVQIENDTVSFSNDLIVHTAESPLDIADIYNGGTFLPDDPDITFGEEYETVVPIQCVYPRHNNVSSSYKPIKQHVRFFEKRYGQLDLYMRQYENDSFSKAVANDGSPRMVPLGNDVYISVGMTFLSTSLTVKLERCIATSTPSPADKNWRELIHLGCPVNGVELLPNPDDQDVKFTFKAFDFRHNSSGFIYVHCEAAVCRRDEPGCMMGCPARARRAVSEGSSGARLISTGPLLVDTQRHSSQGQRQLSVSTVVAALSLLVAMVAVVLAVIGWSRKAPAKPHTDL